MINTTNVEGSFVLIYYVFPSSFLLSSIESNCTSPVVCVRYYEHEPSRGWVTLISPHFPRTGTNAWRFLANLSQPISDGCAAVVDGRLWLVGGEAGVSLLGPAAHRWKEGVAEEPPDLELASVGLTPALQHPLPDLSQTPWWEEGQSLQKPPPVPLEPGQPGQPWQYWPGQQQPGLVKERTESSQALRSVLLSFFSGHQTSVPGSRTQHSGISNKRLWRIWRDGRWRGWRGLWLSTKPELQGQLLQ